jgi:hypothetical protein
LTLLDDSTLAIYGSKTTAPYRIDHCIFDDGSAGSVTLVEVSGNGPGLIDQCKFVAGAASEIIHNYGMGAQNASGWSDEVIPGSAAAVHVEDCTFSKNPLADKYFWGTAAISSYYCARTVMRYCHLNYRHIDQHGNVPHCMVPAGLSFTIIPSTFQQTATNPTISPSEAAAVWYLTTT